MFVQENSVAACLDYMKKRLADSFSDTEIRLIQWLAFDKRLNFSRSDLMLRKNDGLSESDLLFFRDVVKRLLEDEPVQYILGQTEFCELKLKIDKRALIPRPETEELVYALTEELKRKEINSPTIIDLCTGSGCIALALKSFVPSAKVKGVDVDQDALNLAKENADLTNLEVEFLLENILKVSDSSNLYEENWDVIVSNPPYIPLRDKSQMDQNVLEYEPHIALFVEDVEPLIFYEKIAEYAKKTLKSKGILAVEIHEDLSQETMNIFTKLGFIHVRVLTDLQGKNRMVFAENT